MFTCHLLYLGMILIVVLGQIKMYGNRINLNESHFCNFETERASSSNLKLHLTLLLNQPITQRSTSKNLPFLLPAIITYVPCLLLCQSRILGVKIHLKIDSKKVVLYCTFRKPRNTEIHYRGKKCCRVKDVFTHVSFISFLFRRTFDWSDIISNEILCFQPNLLSFNHKTSLSLV